MSKYIKLEDAIYADCILIDEIECDDCPFYDEEYALCRMVKWLESLPTIDIVECEECRWRYVCSQVVSDIGCEGATLLRWCSDGERKDNE